MQYILDLMNKIKWDENEHPEDYVIGYMDRITKKITELPYPKIKRVEGTFMIILDDKGEEVNIPSHRVKYVKKKGEIIWQRQ